MEENCNFVCVLFGKKAMNALVHQRKSIQRMKWTKPETIYIENDIPKDF